MDRSSGNQKLLEELSKERKADKHHQLINIGSCGLQTIHSAFKTDAENAKWNTKQVLKGAFQVFHGSLCYFTIQQHFTNNCNCQIFV